MHAQGQMTSTVLHTCHGTPVRMAQLGQQRRLGAGRASRLGSLRTRPLLRLLISTAPPVLLHTTDSSHIACVPTLLPTKCSDVKGPRMRCTTDTNIAVLMAGAEAPIGLHAGASHPGFRWMQNHCKGCRRPTAWQDLQLVNVRAAVSGAPAAAARTQPPDRRRRQSSRCRAAQRL